MKNLFTSIFIFSTFALHAQIRYVNQSATGTNNGTSWQDAYTSLQSALTSNAAEIRVASGIYTPTPDTSRDVSFILKDGFSIYGGFPTQGNPTWEDRDWENNPTILSGDIGSAGDTADNSYHVIAFSAGFNFNATLDGLIVEGGNSDYSGGGMDGSGGWQNADRNLMVSNCLFRNNYAAYEGGAVSLWTMDATFKNCIFEDNFSGYEAGALEVSGAYMEYQYLAKVTDCVFRNNYAGNGAAITSSWITTLIDRCHFENNQAENGGGAIEYFSNWFQNDEVHLVCSNSLFVNNSAGYGGGAASTVGHSQWLNCIFQENFAEYEGGAISHFDHGAMEAINCTFVDNLTEGSGSAFEIFSWSQDTVVVQADFANCIFSSNQGQLFENNLYQDRFNLRHCLMDVASCPPSVTCGDGMLFDSDPAFVDFGDFHLNPTSPCINAGKNDALPDSLLVDLDGNDRIINNIVDIGPYEFGGTVSTEEKPDLSVSIFPNPARHSFFVNTQGRGFEASLFNLQGQAVQFWESAPGEGVSSLSLAGIPSGLYMVAVSMDGGEAYTEKLFVLSTGNK